ncbi:unnamed protein product, partial [Rotaria sordida]
FSEFSDLNDEDQTTLKEKFGATVQSKRKCKGIELSSELIKAKQAKTDDEIAENFNEQEQTRLRKLIEAVADYMAFGALESCPECGGFLVFNYTNYRCTGNITEWTTYSYTTNLPKRKAFEIPDRIKEDYDMLPDYDPKLPLNGYSVALIGRLLKRKSILKKHIEQLGGAMTTNIDKTVGVVVSTQDEIKTLLSFNIDLRKMSLRKLSRNQLKIAYGVLTELQTLITSDSINKTSIIDASNRFYTRISHDFGRKKPQILNNVDFIQSKTQMIDNLLDIKIVYSMLKRSSEGNNEHPIDVHYKKLKCVY